VIRSALAGLVALALAGAATPAQAGERPSLYWKWSDGSTARTRSIPLSDAMSVDALPGLVVTTRPATPGLAVLLQYTDRTGRHTEDMARTAGDGRAHLHLNPFAANGDWARGSRTYLLVVGAQTAGLRVSFSR
jgi:hypothetical protein